MSRGIIVGPVATFTLFWCLAITAAISLVKRPETQVSASYWNFSR